MIKVDTTKRGKALRNKSLEAVETILAIEREQRDRDQARLAKVMIVALEHGVKLGEVAREDCPSERNFLRRVLLNYEKKRTFELTGLCQLGLEFEEEAT